MHKRETREDRMTRTVTILALAAANFAGCGGVYTVVAPDAAGAAGGETAAAARLLRNDLVLLNWPQEDQPLTFNGAGARRAAYTDDQGYAVVSLPVPQDPGPYRVKVHLQDVAGDETSAELTLWSFQPDRLTVAVDFEAVEDNPSEAAPALVELAEAEVQIAYFSEEYADQPGEGRAMLAAWSAPAGPVLSWSADRNWLGQWRGVSGALPALRRDVGALLIGLTDEDDAQRLIAEMDMIPLALDDAGATDRSLAVAGWAEAARRILAARVALAENTLQATSAEVAEALGAE
jgi:hypothetical protein